MLGAGGGSPISGCSRPIRSNSTGDVRLVAVNGEKSWVDGGFGKLRSGATATSSSGRSSATSASSGSRNSPGRCRRTIVGAVQGGERTQAGLSQAYLSFRPMRSSSGTAFSARAGLMWPPVSLEHEGADWHVADSITPSAINSWIGEEVRPVAVEGTLRPRLGEHRLRVTAAIFAANDTSGTLLTFRGWALHDRTTLAFNRRPLPPLDHEIAGMAGALHPSAARPRIRISHTGPAIM